MGGIPLLSRKSPPYAQTPTPRPESSDADAECTVFGLLQSTLSFKYERDLSCFEIAVKSKIKIK